VTIIQPVVQDPVTLEVVRQSHVDARYVPKVKIGLFRIREEIWVELRNAAFFGPNEVFELFTLLEWVEFTEGAEQQVRLEGGGVRVGVLYFTRREWDFFCAGVVRGAFAPPPAVYGRAA